MNISGLEFPARRALILGALGFGAGLPLAWLVGQIAPTMFMESVVLQSALFALWGGIGGAMLGLAEESRRHVLRLALAGYIGVGLGWLSTSLAIQLWMNVTAARIFEDGSAYLISWIAQIPAGITAGAVLGWVSGGPKSSLKLGVLGGLAFGLCILIKIFWFNTLPMPVAGIVFTIVGLFLHGMLVGGIFGRALGREDRAKKAAPAGNASANRWKNIFQMDPLTTKQYSGKRILGLWALAALPMVILAWGAAPLLVSVLPLPGAAVYLILMTAGGLWPLIFSLWIIRREEGNLRWETLRRRIWLNPPLQPKTGEPRRRLFFWLLPCLVVGIFSLFLGAILTGWGPTILRSPIVGLFHLVPSPMFSWASTYSWWPYYANAAELASPEMAGLWGLIAVAVVNWLLGAFFAEELFFRGVLLPKMNGRFGSADWIANAGLYALYFAFRPWMIPFHFANSLVLTLPARRFRSNWMAVAIHAAEGFFVVVLVCIGVFSRSSISMDLRGGLNLTGIFPPEWNLPATTTLDLSPFDMRDAYDRLLQTDFDTKTIWPPKDRLPEGFDPAQIMDMGMNPGLGIRSLHALGITGKGVNIAVIDQPLEREHEEYVDRLKLYEEINILPGTGPQMHGPAVASIAVGKTVGVAPEANLYYFATWAFDPKGEQGNNELDFRFYAQAVRRVLELNQSLPQDRKIRVISLSIGWSPGDKNYAEITAAVQEAKSQGILVLSSSLEDTYGFKYNGLGRAALADPDDFESYEPGIFWADGFYGGYDDPSSSQWFSGRLLVPMDSRTTAGFSGPEDYVFYRQGGWSWATPYLAGMFALAQQADEDITPDSFWAAALETGRTIEFSHNGRTYRLGPILDPVALIAALEGNSSAAP